jgi:CRISPR-associated protein Cas2
MFVVVSYDIPEDRRRTRVMKLLKNYGRHVQFSVFECDLTPIQLATLRDRLRGLLHPPMDNVRLYFLSEDDVARIESLAGRGLVRDPVMYMA